VIRSTGPGLILITAGHVISGRHRPIAELRHRLLTSLPKRKTKRYRHPTNCTPEPDLAPLDQILILNKSLFLSESDKALLFFVRPAFQCEELRQKHE